MNKLFYKTGYYLAYLIELFFAVICIVSLYNGDIFSAIVFMFIFYALVFIFERTIHKSKL